MALVLASTEWPGLTYSFWRQLKKFEHNGLEWWMEWNHFGRLDWWSQELCCITLIQTGGDYWSLCWGLVERAHLIVCGTISLACRSFAELLVVTCQLSVCTTCLLCGTSSVCVQPHLGKSNRWEVVSDIWRHLPESFFWSQSLGTLRHNFSKKK